MRTLIHQLKYSDRLESRSLLARWLEHAGRDLLDGADVIVPVPLSRGRLLWRRFNQSALLAQALAARTRKPFDPFVLTRTRTRTRRPQVGLSERERKANVAGAFSVAPARRSRITGRHIVLVDDVVTTGATVEACATALLKAGARRVDVLALALATAEVGPVV
jgi:ComF family protein